MTISDPYGATVYMCGALAGDNPYTGEKLYDAQCNGNAGIAGDSVGLGTEAALQVSE